MRRGADCGGRTDGLLGRSFGAEAGDPSDEGRGARVGYGTTGAAGGEAGRRLRTDVEVEGITGFAAQGWIEVRGTKSSIRDPARQQQQGRAGG